MKFFCGSWWHTPLRLRKVQNTRKDERENENYFDSDTALVVGEQCEAFKIELVLPMPSLDWCDHAGPSIRQVSTVKFREDYCKIAIEAILDFCLFILSLKFIA